MDSTLGSIPFTNCYLDDILIASKGTFLDNKNIVLKILSTLDKYNFAMSKFFQTELSGWDLKSQTHESPLYLTTRKR